MKESMRLTLNAQFYFSKDLLGRDAHKAVLDAASENQATSAPLHQELYVTGQLSAGTEYSYSLKIFKAERPAYFLPGGEYVDLIYAYIFIVQVTQHICIFKQGCANISRVLQRLASPVTQAELFSTIEHHSPSFQKLAFRNMTVSDKAIRNRSYEASNLEGAISVHGAGRSIPTFVRVRDGDTLRTVNISSSRLNDSAVRVAVDAAVDWAARKIQAFGSGGSTKFLASFARKLELNEVLKVASPSSILIEAGALFESITDAGYEIVRVRRGIEVPLSGMFLSKLFKRMERVYEVAGDLAITGRPLHSRIKLNSRSITFSDQVLKKIFVKEDGAKISLQAYVIKYGLFAVCFSDPRYMYFAGQAFEDRSGTSEIDALLEILEVKPSLTVANSEKGAPINSDRSFEDKSVFGIVEGELASSSLLFCDDLGDEWADHIAINLGEACISFVHSKYGEVSTSASNLHDVVGQGIKNLGNMFFTIDGIKAKLVKWRGFYSDTGIARLRAGTGKGATDQLRQLLRDHKLHRRCVLVCPFLSKKEVRKEFIKMKKGEKVRGHITQLLWILSSFSHAAKEMSVVPQVWCRP